MILRPSTTAMGKGGGTKKECHNTSVEVHATIKKVQTTTYNAPRPPPSPDQSLRRKGLKQDLFAPFFFLFGLPARSSPLGMLRFTSDINQPSLPTPFYSVLVSISVFMALSTVFHSVTSPANSPFSHSVLPVLFLPYWSFQLYISL